MTVTEGLGLLVLVGLTAYAVLGGADFGAGLWDLSRQRRQRELVVRSMAPVWEANHVWLIFVAIALFSGFPEAFAALSRSLTGPLSIALLGIVLRGAAFAFRQYGAPYGGRPVRGTGLWARIFAVSSLVTPFAFGAAAGGITTGRVRADGSAGFLAPFLAPLPLVSGLLAVAACGFLAAVYLTADADREGDEELVNRLRVRALVTGVIAGGLALAALPLLPAWFARQLSLPAMAISVVCGALALELVRRGHYQLARVAAAGAPAALLGGWALAMQPWVLPGEVPLRVASEGTASLILGILICGLMIVLPSYWYMIRVLRAPRTTAEARATDRNTVAGR
ncbi:MULTISPECIES: cytochrome d ubiquinol oxidase subunit II [Thermocrispum]|uniref:cytochrome d ubiquinol oxidase subunit II n=1 Tax=Thermocrispum TaxID=37924 RepID=UPI0003FB583D|nr:MULTISPECIES: cytochrome d ubiquinol oxidase subunit II [Thermocrispum]